MTERIQGQFEIISGYKNTKPFLSQVQEAADAHRSALGFFPSSVYEDFAKNDRLFICIDRSTEKPKYAGHILFDGRFPRAKIRQMFTHPDFRRCGIATKLLNHFRNALTRMGFTSVYARVAEDLTESNKFWEKQCFYIQRVEKGGTSRNRQILVRCLELESPQLFPTSGINSENPLGLKTTTTNITPFFLLDLNVLFDVAGPRRPRHSEAKSLFQAERMNFCRLAISNEIRAELQRTRLPGKTDPMEGYIDIFPSVPLLQLKELSGLLNELAQLIFPSKNIEELTANDLSDIRHVATVIQHDLAGLITNDQAVLDAANKIEEKYDIEIISTAAFEINDTTTSTSGSFETLKNSTLNLKEISSKNNSDVHALLSKLKLSGSTIANGWLPTEDHERVAIRRAVWCEETLIGYLTWSTRGTAGVTTARIAVDETNQQALSSARILLIHLLEQLISFGPRQVTLEFPAQQSHVREIAVGFGFKGTQDPNCLVKLILGKVLTISTWPTHQNELATKSGLKIPATAPTYKGPDQYIPILTPAGNREHLPLDILESALSPALLCLPGRPAVITPVQRSFSEPLLGHSPQGSLLPFCTASIFQDRHYVSSSSTLKHFKRGTLILFYESAKQRGSSEIVAIARVRQAYLKPSDSLDDSDLEQSVLSTESIARIGKSKMKTVTVFDNIFPLPHPVPLSTLQRIGCGRPNDLITTKPITEIQLQEILLEAFRNG